MKGTELIKMDRRQFILRTTAAASGAAWGAREVKADLPRKTSAKLALDPRRPQYHLLPAANWMNDPNGPIYWNGKYHMFFQYNPDGAYWGDMHWDHAISKDMIYWKHLPVALAPTPGGPDAAGCFTGTAVLQDGKVVLMYTGVHSAPPEQATIKDGANSLQEKQCLAIAKDLDLRTWTKIEEPVITAPPPELQVNGFRDPSPWRQGEWWYTVLGSGIANEGGAVLLYRSRDLRHWEFLHVLTQRDHHDQGRFAPYDPWEVWECPEFFPLGDRHVLICSTNGKAYWQTGRLDTEEMVFHPEHRGILDYGSFYAPKTQLDSKGNRILWGWITEARPLEAYRAAGWAGLMSLPRILRLTPNGHLRFEVAPVANQLRKVEQALVLSNDDAVTRKRIDALRVAECCGEILCTTKRSSAGFEFCLADVSEGEAPWMTVKFNPARPDEILIDARPIPLALVLGRDLEFHFYIDGSVIELFVNAQIAWTKRFYYSGDNARDLCIRWKGNASIIKRLSVWNLMPISHDRLTS
jgi:beta-fructofuranosidase